MTAATYTSADGASDWSDEVITEAINRPCPYCEVQPPENCHGDNLEVFTGPMGHVIKLHTPRLRQVPSYSPPSGAE